LCDEKEQAKCRAEMGDGPELEWACNHCPKKKAQDLHAYTFKLFRLRRLRMAGYPFEANDLTVEEWMDLGRIEEIVNS